MSFKKKFKETIRLSEIITVLFEEGLHYLIYEFELHSFVPFLHRTKHKLGFKIKRNFEDSIVIACQRLGGLFLKAGKMLSSRPDLIPKSLAKEFERLEDKEKAVPKEQIISIIEQEFKMPISDLFSNFGDSVFTASFGQIHRAKFKNTIVAVKVQRPDIDKVFEDLKILKFLFKHLLKKRPDLKKFNLLKIHKEIEKFIKAELDYNVEAKNTKKFFEFSDNIIVPQVLKSSKKVLILSWEEGKKLNSFFKKGNWIAKSAISFLLKQYFELGIFHADPVSSNLRVRNNKLVIYDFGEVGKLNKKEQRILISIFSALFLGDFETVTQKFAELSGKKRFSTVLLMENKELIKAWQKNYFQKHNTNPLKSKIKISQKQLKQNKNKYNTKTTKKNQKLKSEDCSLSNLFFELTLNAIDDKLSIPSDLLLFAKSFMSAEKLGLKLDPNFDLFKETKFQLVQIILKKYGVRALLKMGLHDAENKFEKQILKIPRLAESLIKKLIR